MTATAVHITQDDPVFEVTIKAPVKTIRLPLNFGEIYIRRASEVLAGERAQEK